MGRFLFLKEKSNSFVFCYVVEDGTAYLEYKIQPISKIDSFDKSTKVIKFEVLPELGITKTAQRINQFSSELNFFSEISLERWIDEIMFEVERIDEIHDYFKIRKLLKI